MKGGGGYQSAAYGRLIYAWFWAVLGIGEKTAKASEESGKVRTSILVTVTNGDGFNSEETDAKIGFNNLERDGNVDEKS